MPGSRATSFLALPMAALLAGCSVTDTISDAVSSTVGSAYNSTLGSGPSSTAQPDTGLAVGDEPFAVKTGTAILAEGVDEGIAEVARLIGISLIKTLGQLDGGVGIHHGTLKQRGDGGTGIETAGGLRENPIGGGVGIRFSPAGEGGRE